MLVTLPTEIAVGVLQNRMCGQMMRRLGFLGFLSP